jgi:hypothetical protein
MRKEGAMKYVLGGIGILAVALVLVLMAIGGFKGSSPSSEAQGAVRYDKEDQNRPKAVLSTTTIEWGSIKVSDTQESIVELRNDGETPLEITRMSTSCGCTSVKVIYSDGNETKEYGMHKTSEKVTVASGTMVKLKIVYRPYSMPVEGAVTRQVFLETNDPANTKLTIDASAIVSK